MTRLEGHRLGFQHRVMGEVGANIDDLEKVSHVVAEWEPLKYDTFQPRRTLFEERRARETLTPFNLAELVRLVSGLLPKKRGQVQLVTSKDVNANGP